MPPLKRGVGETVPGGTIEHGHPSGACVVSQDANDGCAGSTIRE